MRPIPVGNRSWGEHLYKMLRGGLSYGDGTNSDNIAGQWAAVTSPGAANTEFAVAHGLRKVPTGFHVLKKNAACDVYAGTTAWTSTHIYLKATGTTVALTLFITV